MFFKITSIVLTFVASFSIAAASNMKVAYCNDDENCSVLQTVVASSECRDMEETTSPVDEATLFSNKKNEASEQEKNSSVIDSTIKNTTAAIPKTTEKNEAVTVLQLNKTELSKTTKTHNQNHILIPDILSTDIVILNYIGTQKDVDNNDVVSDLRYGGQRFVYGHNYYTLKNLHKVSVGESIYLTINGKTKVYRVFVSEYGVETPDCRNIVGQKSGICIYDKYEAEVIRIFTCHGEPPKGRWIVMAKSIN